jgi:predicted RNase H-like nuclease (RuvC/YqgF family)
MKNRKQTLERLIQEQSAIVEKARKDFEELNTDLQGKIELSVYLTMQMETLSRLYVKLFECND